MQVLTKKLSFVFTIPKEGEKNNLKRALYKDFDIRYVTLYIIHLPASKLAGVE